MMTDNNNYNYKNDTNEEKEEDGEEKEEEEGQEEEEDWKKFIWGYKGETEKYLGAAVVQWNHARFGVRGISKRTGSNPVHGPSVGWASSLGGNGFLASGL
ncbi:hypothetical protein E2C01_083816 [Portunus trituberculatus]|uniref:Uncharacterized protein n=1 Tax=Portunus trituberculatus TaxID=210409 RepID=A0A5B7IY33_PORTR|nr:hypothetical protein [Portunus trituberculatus]